MRSIVRSLIVGVLVHSVSAQCMSSYSSCSSCNPSGTSNIWCSSTGYSYDSGCCISSGSYCPSYYSYRFDYSCSTYRYNDQNFCDSLCITINVFYWLTWAINLVAVVKYCKKKNIPPCCYIVLACFFGLCVWCCLYPAGQNSQPIVVVNSQGVPYQAHTTPGVQYAVLPNGQQFYSQQGGYIPPGQPVFIYAQPASAQQLSNQPVAFTPGNIQIPNERYGQPVFIYAQPAPAQQPSNQSSAAIIGMTSNSNESSSSSLLVRESHQQ